MGGVGFENGADSSNFVPDTAPGAASGTGL